MKRIIYVLAVLLAFVVSSCDKEDPKEKPVDGFTTLMKVDVSGLEVTEEPESHTLIGDLPSTGGELRISISQEADFPYEWVPRVDDVRIDNVGQERMPALWDDIIEQEGAISEEVEEVFSNSSTQQWFLKYNGDWGYIDTDFTSLPISIVVKIEENRTRKPRVIEFELSYLWYWRGFKLTQAPSDE